MSTKPIVPRERANEDVDDAIAYYVKEHAEQAVLGFIDALEDAYARATQCGAGQWLRSILPCCYGTPRLLRGHGDRHQFVELRDRVAESAVEPQGRSQCFFGHVPPDSQFAFGVADDGAEQVLNARAQ